MWTFQWLIQQNKNKARLKSESKTEIQKEDKDGAGYRIYTYTHTQGWFVIRHWRWKQSNNKDGKKQYQSIKTLFINLG